MTVKSKSIDVMAPSPIRIESEWEAIRALKRAKRIKKGRFSRSYVVQGADGAYYLHRVTTAEYNGWIAPTK